MPTPVLMPQMGESVAEGTIVRWIRHVGDAVERDQPLFEISTDKVDAEIPSPSAGVILEIKVQEGETVAVNSVVALIEEAAGATPSPPAGSGLAQVPPAPGKPQERLAAGDEAPAPAETGEEHQRLSPVVRKIAREHGVDLSKIAGTGGGGRVTRDDVLNYVRSMAAVSEKPAGQAPSTEDAGRVQRVPMSVMRRRIAEHMLLSRRTSAHVHSTFEVNFARVNRILEDKRAEYERAGVKLTHLAFVTRAAAAALKAVPEVNASIEGNDVLYKQDINVGIAVSLDWGLIVPVVRDVDRKSLLEIGRSIGDLAGRARAKQLTPDDVQGGTFTITNPGVFGGLFGMPIINQPQVAILALGAIQKRPVVIDDEVKIAPMAYVVLGFDHRLIDGAVGDRFLSIFKRQIEEFDPAWA